jgi:hypothetical protein
MTSDDTPLYSKGDDIFSIYTEAVARTKKQGYNPDSENLEEAYKFVNARIANMEIIKKEREAAKQKAQLKQLQPTEEKKKEELTIAADANLDDLPPTGEPAITEISREPSRMELKNQISYIDKARIEPLYHFTDDIIKEMKILSDKIKSLESKIDK